MVMDMATATAMATARKRKLSSVRSSWTPLAVVMGCAAIPAFAGDWKITPSITVQETMTDNVSLSSRNEHSDLITDVSPGIRIDGSGGRAKLNLDYRLHKLYYLHDASSGDGQSSSRNGYDTQHSLNAFGTVEALENWFFIDASGRISQQSISPFYGSTSTSVNVNTDNNTTETSTYRLSPYFRGRLGGFADYLLRYSVSTTKTDTGYSNDSDSRELLLNLKGVTPLASLGWSIDASTQDVEYDDEENFRFGSNRSYESDIERATLTYQVSPQFRVSLIGGREANDYLTVDKESHTIKGAGFEWAPTERTRLAVTREDRFFGKANRIDFTHRTPRTVWQYTETEDATANPDQQTAYGLGSYYDLFFNLFSSAIPDPAMRAAYVNALLLTNGISPDAQLQGGYLTSGATKQHLRQLSFAITGARNTVTFAATRSETDNLYRGQGSGLFTGDYFANYRNTRQRGASVNWSHKLTPHSTLVAMFSHLRSEGSGTNSIETTQKTFNLNLTTKLTEKTSASIGARRVIYDGDTGYGDYTENALVATLNHQF